MSQIFNIEDASQYLIGVWIGVKQDDGTLKPWQCHDVRTVGGNVVLKCVREEDGDLEWLNVKCDDVFIDISCPDLGAINVGGIPLYLSRRTQRQWRRGWRSSQTLFVDPSHDFRFYLAHDEACKYRKDSHKPELVDAIFNPKYVPIKKAVSDIYGGESFGAAISKDYYVYCNNNAKSPVIGYKSQDVAIIDDSMTVSLYNDCTHLTESLSEVMAE